MPSSAIVNTDQGGSHEKTKGRLMINALARLFSKYDTFTKRNDENRGHVSRSHTGTGEREGRGEATYNCKDHAPVVKAKVLDEAHTDKAS